MNSKSKLFFAGLAIIFAAACSGPFNLDHALPDDATNIDQVAPASIKGINANAACRVFGTEGDPVVHYGIVCESTYDNLGTILAGKFDTTKNAKLFWRHHQTTINRSASTLVESVDVDWTKYNLENGGMSFLWRKNNWVFAVTGNTPADHAALVEAFQHISPKQ